MGDIPHSKSVLVQFEVTYVPLRELEAKMWLRTIRGYTSIHPFRSHLPTERASGSTTCSQRFSIQGIPDEGQKARDCSFLKIMEAGNENPFILGESFGKEKPVFAIKHGIPSYLRERIRITIIICVHCLVDPGASNMHHASQECGHRSGRLGRGQGDDDKEETRADERGVDSGPATAYRGDSKGARAKQEVVIVKSKQQAVIPGISRSVCVAPPHFLFLQQPQRAGTGAGTDATPGWTDAAGLCESTGDSTFHDDTLIEASTEGGRSVHSHQETFVAETHMLSYSLAYQMFWDDAELSAVPKLQHSNLDGIWYQRVDEVERVHDPPCLGFIYEVDLSSTMWEWGGNSSSSYFDYQARGLLYLYKLSINKLDESE
ncbi:hypothetical protein C8R45DRAFT_948481 [Mycena sanguinolenta]|nr:hypothetical protein C8R45DRAFT_948481 [Mycena sanguinolenta]